MLDLKVKIGMESKKNILVQNFPSAIY